MEIENLWIALHPYIMKTIAVAVIAVVTYGLNKLLSKIIGAILRGAEVRYIVRIVDITRMLLYLIAAIVIANIIAPEVLVFSFLVLLIGLATIFMFIDLLRNMGAELYVRAKDIVRRGDWIEVDGVSVKVVDFDAVGLIGETAKLEKVFVPYTKLLSSIVVNKVTPFGMLVRIYVDLPQSYGIDGARNILLESLETVKEDLASEPDVTYLGSKEDKLNFVIEFHIINYRKSTKILAAIDREIKNKIPEAIVRA
ncbi:MAG: mechanosensitive ion channel family protein [Ignisphaera sp.]|uniref:Mechanosensitive ion channel family protein n=1 Tax=Ignisphaera aggregans TaxID=334771 RepID=A0A7C4NMW4_9CREN